MTREQQIHFAGMLNSAEAHVTKALDELAAALELKRGDELVMHERQCLEQVALGLSWRAERMREAVEAA